jgi:sec-independent protein translocase protein TatC
LFIGGGLFLVGISFCYFLLMPVALAASQMYSNWLGLGAMHWRAEEYISFVCKFMLGMGLGFQLPVVILTLVKIGVLNYRLLRSMWRYMIVINLILGALLTTPEVITQVMMAGPLYGLYEITVWIAWYWEQPDRAKARRTLLLALLVLAGLAWLAYEYALPWLKQFIHH